MPLIKIMWQAVHQRLRQVDGGCWKLGGWVPIAFDGSRNSVTHQPSEVPRIEVGWDQPLGAQAHPLSPGRASRGGPAVQSDLVPPYMAAELIGSIVRPRCTRSNYAGWRGANLSGIRRRLKW